MASNEKSKKAKGQHVLVGYEMISLDFMNSPNTSGLVAQMMEHEWRKFLATYVETMNTMTRGVEVGLDAVIAAAPHGSQALGLGNRPKKPGEAVDPPERAELLLRLVPRRDREPILGDLEEDFRTDFLPKFGPEKARRLYWWHAVRSVFAIALGRVQWLIRVVAVGWLLGRFGL